MVSSCDDGREVASSPDTGSEKVVVAAPVAPPDGSSEDVRIQNMLSLEEKKLAVEELRIEEKLRAEAEERDAELKALAGEVERREDESQQELERKLARMKTILKKDGSDQVLTGSVNTGSN